MKLSHRCSQDFLWGGGALFFLEKVDDFLLFSVIALKTPLPASRSPQFPKKWTLALPGGALTTFPCKFGTPPGYAYELSLYQNIFSSRWKVITEGFT